MSPSVYLAIPLMAALAVLQTSALFHLSLLGVTPQILILVAIAWGLLYGLEEGLVWAFVAGFFLDLFSAAPLGTSSLALMIGMLPVGYLRRYLPPGHIILPLILAALTILIYLLLYLALLRLSGYPVNLDATTTLPTHALLHSLLVLPIYWLLYNLRRLLRPERIEV